MRRFGIILGLMVGMAAAPTSADEARGYEIAAEADRRAGGFEDSAATLRMVLRDGRGGESERALRIRILEGPDGDIDLGNKSLIVFDSPADQRGTALLTYGYKSEPDDQWLYLPALKRVKRIAASNKSGPFVGSEFAYEDFAGQELEKFTYRYLRDEQLDGIDCFVIERIPVGSDSGYTRQVVWLDKEEYRIWKIEYYDRKESLLKTLRVSDYRLYDEKHWRPGASLMVNHQTAKSTLLNYTDYRFGNGFTDADFSRNSLKRMR
ncbi:MAG: outer membrane lipoprotein-sorting protein [Pseudomonadota bacterium]|nr:outer membrane lipoprotein-sorting protein [Pseudomonadota bacterium]